MMSSPLEHESTPSRRRFFTFSAPTPEFWALLALTLLAFVLRVWGTHYGLPQPDTRPDEYRWVRVGLGLLEDPNPRWFQWPTLHAYVLAAAYALWGAFRLAHGDFTSWHAYMNEDLDVYLADHVLLGRWVCALFGALVIPAVWRLGERLGSRRVGIIAAFWMAVSFGPVRDAHWALIESLLLFGIVVTLIVTLWACERPTLPRFIIAGFVAGLTMSAKYSGMTLAAPIALAVVFARLKESEAQAASTTLTARIVRAALGSAIDPRGILAALALALGFLAGTPYVFAAWPQFKAAMVVREWSYRDTSFGTDIGFYHHLVFSLRYSHGVLLELCGLIGLFVYGLRQRWGALLLVYGVGTYVALGPAHIIPMRYASSLAPCIVIGAAWLIADLSDRMRRPAAWLIALTLLLAAEPLYRDIRFNQLLTRTDTRVTARDWFALNVPAGQKILSRESKALRWGRPILEDRYLVEPFLNRKARRRVAPYAIIAEAPIGYVPEAPEMHALLQSVGHIAVIFNPYEKGAAPIYDPHDAFFVPVAGFAGVREPGPRITIYKIDQKKNPAPETDEP